jgi:hypothetical protein
LRKTFAAQTNADGNNQRQQTHALHHTSSKPVDEYKMARVKREE